MGRVFPTQPPRVNAPKREELLLRTVFALPKASSSGFSSNTRRSMLPPPSPAPSARPLGLLLLVLVLVLLVLVLVLALLPPWPAPSCARHAMISLLVSVLPAPLSPVICNQGVVQGLEVVESQRWQCSEKVRYVNLAHSFFGILSSIGCPATQA